MRILFAAALLATATAFAPAIKTKQPLTKLDVHRRDVLITALGGLLIAPHVAEAAGSTFFFDDKIETVREPSQMHTGGKIDLNSAFIVSTDMLLERDSSEERRGVDLPSARVQLLSPSLLSIQ